MADSDHRKSLPPQKRQGFRRTWCCSFTNPPKSPENLTSFYQSKMTQIKSGNSFPNSPQSNRASLGLVGRMDPRRILSPGRVSPIDSDNTPLDHSLLENLPAEPSAVVGDEIGSEKLPEKSPELEMTEDDEVSSEKFDVRLSLKGKDGGSLVLELDSKVLSENSSVFANLISEYHKNSGGLANLYRIEVPEVENLNVFHQTIELMYAEDITQRMVNMGVSRSIDTLEVAAGIMFTKGVLSCLKYIEAVPWSEDEEEKLKSLFARYAFDKRTAEDVLARLYSGEELVNSQQHLAIQLINSITNCTNLSYSSKELKSLVKGLLSKSSVYEKDLTGLKKEDLYQACKSCLNSLVGIFQEASDSIVPEEERGSSGRVESSTRPFIERISVQVDNIKWLLEILMEQQMAEEFVSVWAEQEDLLRMHEMVSPMVRYEVSRISASVFIALGRGKLLCQSESRCGVFQAWFGPMLLDYGWLQRCRKGLDVKVLEESMGQALLMLPMKHQHVLFMEWFQSYSRHGAECPNLSKAFQIWWRRSFLRGSRSHTVELESSESW
ncbi:BTB/POZ-like [Macleaya cordata]|uniref:BTB/POZ-like n=1 Tax=Macleaya cordata TaxID=56857 RepID=A0A200Q8K8_MACCD|nr:BTB/POZ-like [Macleaya cordata]